MDMMQLLSDFGLPAGICFAVRFQEARRGGSDTHC